MCRNLHHVIEKTGKKLAVKVQTVPLWVRYSRKRPQQAFVNYPVLKITEWARYIFNTGGHFFLGGRSMDHLPTVRQELRVFWQRYRAIDPTFPPLQTWPAGDPRWEFNIPIAIHGDEGRGRGKQPIMILSAQPVLPLHMHSTNMRGCLGLRELYRIGMQFDQVFHDFHSACDAEDVVVHASAVCGPAAALHQAELEHALGSVCSGPQLFAQRWT